VDNPCRQSNFIQWWRAVSMLSRGCTPGVLGAKHLAKLAQVQPCLDGLILIPT
jgi:hypothetical protein